MIQLGRSFSPMPDLGAPRVHRDALFRASESKENSPELDRSSDREKESFSNVLRDKRETDNDRATSRDKEQRTSDYSAKSSVKDETQSERSNTRQSVEENKPVDQLPEAPKEQVKKGSTVEDFNSDKYGQAEIAESNGVENKETKVAARVAEIKDSEVDPVTQKVAMTSFLKKMQDQLGVSPEQVILAFAKMDQSALMLPPDEAVDQWAEALSVAPNQQEAAKKLFQDMLRQSASTEVADYLKGSGQDLKVEVFSEKELKQRQVNQGLDDLNSRFFVDNQARSNAKEQAEVQMMKSRLGLSDQNQKEPEASHSALGAPMGGSGHGKTAGIAPMSGGNSIDLSSMTTATPSDLSAEELQVLQNKPLQKFSESGTPQNIVMQPQGQATSPSLIQANSPTNIEGLEVVDSNVAKSSIESSQWALEQQPIKIAPTVAATPYGKMAQSESGQQMAQEVSGAAVNADSLKVTAKEDSGENLEGEMSYEGKQQELGSMGQKASEATGKSSQFVLAKPTPTASEESANVRQVINNAQILIKRGGGEMKVALSPEGMGEVTLKVAMQNGAVNVEMVTDSNDAKKILEKGLGDLKATLASHKLNVEGIKVDVSQQLSTDLNQQQDPNERFMAQRFLEDFRNGNQSWRQEFFDIPGARAVKSQTDGEADSPIKTDQSRSEKSKRRLDMVA